MTQMNRRACLKLGAAMLAPTVFSARATIDSPVELEVSNYIRELRHQGRIAHDERTAWSVYDFTLGQKLVAINERKQLQCASMIKPFIVLAYFYLSDANPVDYPYSAHIRHVCEQMIVKSSNHATNELMQRCGGPGNVQYILHKYSKSLYRGLRFVEYIPKGGRTYKNRASAKDYQQFLYALWHEQMPMASEMQRLMSLPNNDRLLTGTMLPDWINVYDKTGSTAMMCGNMGILELSQVPLNRAYSFVGVIEKARRTEHYAHWITERSQVMREVSEIVYYHLARKRIEFESLG